MAAFTRTKPTLAEELLFVMCTVPASTAVKKYMWASPVGKFVGVCNGCNKAGRAEPNRLTGRNVLPSFEVPSFSHHIFPAGAILAVGALSTIHLKSQFFRRWQPVSKPERPKRGESACLDSGLSFCRVQSNRSFV
jgi:hypothetical protein